MIHIDSYAVITTQVDTSAHITLLSLNRFTAETVIVYYLRDCADDFLPPNCSPTCLHLGSEGVVWKRETKRNTRQESYALISTLDRRGGLSKEGMTVPKICLRETTTSRISIITVITIGTWDHRVMMPDLLAVWCIRVRLLYNTNYINKVSTSQTLSG